jgi:hypothetical protein
MTTSVVPTLQNQLNNALPEELPDILRLMQLGNMLTPLKRTFTGLTASGTADLTAIDGTGETTGAGNPNRVAALAVKTLRVTAATTSTTVGSYGVTDAGGTTVTASTSSVMGICKISDDGKTITFPTADVTAFVIEYIPQAAVSMTAAVSTLTGVPGGTGIGTAP